MPPDLKHVTIEVPFAYLYKATVWYGRYLGLTYMENPTPKGNAGHDAVWFEEKIHLLGVKNWESHSSFAHFALALGDLYESVHALAWHHIVDSGDEWGNDRFFLKDPWGNRIECVR